MVFLIAIYLASISTYKVEDVIPPKKMTYSKLKIVKSVNKFEFGAFMTKSADT